MQAGNVVALPDRRGRMEEPDRERARELAGELVELLGLDTGRVEIVAQHGQVRFLWSHEEHDLRDAAVRG